MIPKIKTKDQQTPIEHYVLALSEGHIHQILQILCLTLCTINPNSQTRNS